MNFKYSFLLILFVCLTSCERSKEIEVEFPETDKLYSIYSIITIPEQFSTFVAYPIYDVLEYPKKEKAIPQSIYLKNQAIEISCEVIQENQLVIGDTLSKENKYYLQTEIDNHILKSESIGFPSKIEIKDSELHQVNDDSKDISLRLYNGKEQQKKYLSIITHLYSKNELIKSENLNHRTIKNPLFINNMYEEELKIPNYVLVFKNNKHTKVNIDRVDIHAYSLTSSAYLFNESRNGQTFGNQYSIDNPTYSNIDKAVGYFATAIVDTLSIEF